MKALIRMSTRFILCLSSLSIGGILPSLTAAAPPPSDAYFGVRLGSLRNATHGLSGQVWLANATALQVTDFRLDKNQKHDTVFAFTSADGTIEVAKSIYRVVSDASGEEILTPMMKKHLSSEGGSEQQHLVVMVPAGKSVREWKQFGVAVGKTMEKKYLSAVLINKLPPVAFCCIHNSDQPMKGIIGVQYNAGTGEISVEDSKTLVLHKLTLEANRAPDAWVFAGKGEVRQSSGRKAFVVGRDTPMRHCSLRDEYRGNTDLRVRLASDQTIYNIEYLSLFCYQYDVDFGHIAIHLDQHLNPVPAYIPAIENDQQQLKLRTGSGELVLESNDIDGSC